MHIADRRSPHGALSGHLEYSEYTIGVAAPPQVGTRTKFCVGGQYLEEVDNGEDYENRREENAR